MTQFDSIRFNATQDKLILDCRLHRVEKERGGEDLREREREREKKKGEIPTPFSPPSSSPPEGFRP